MDDTAVLGDSKQITMFIQPKSKKGNDAKIDGVPVWTTSDSSILTVTAADDGMSAKIKAVGPVGTAQVIVKADADLGQGVREITSVRNFEVAAGEADSLGSTLGEVEEQTDS